MNTLSHEAGGHLAEETDEFFQQLVNHAGGGDPSDEARFRDYAATRLHLTNQTGVAKIILAHLSADSGSMVPTAISTRVPNRLD